MMAMTKTIIDSLLSEWTAAERAGDAEQLATLLTDDFYGVGPLGYILPKAAWTGRHLQGLEYEAFDLDEIQLHLYGDVALVTARHRAVGTHQGQPLPETLRVTLVVVSDSGTARLACVHMSFIGGTPGTPPLPTAAVGEGR